MLTREVIGRILSCAERGEREVRVSLDLGLGESVVRVVGGFADLMGIKVSVGALAEAYERSGDTDILLVTEEGVRKAQFFAGGSFYKLRNVGGGAPTIEINGVHMHRIQEVTPWEDARLKILAAGVRAGSVVLDTATGLGYTAIHSLLRGAARVVSMEKDVNVLKLAEVNPWSRMLEDERVRILLGDASKLVGDLPGSSFTHVIHDPPRFSLSPEMYRESMYKELLRVLKPGGVLLHYVGDPGAHRGLNLPGRVASRLKSVGFTRVRRLDEIMCVVARKPAPGRGF